MVNSCVVAKPVTQILGKPLVRYYANKQPDDGTRRNYIKNIGNGHANAIV